LQIDSSGNAIVTGEPLRTTNTDYVVLKISPEGLALWTNFMAGPSYNGGSVPQTQVDPKGNIYLIGGTPGASKLGFYQIVKYEPNGRPIWTNSANFPGTNAAAYASTVDAAGNLYLAGFARDASPYAQFVTMKFNSDGHAAWTNRFSGSTFKDSFAFGVAVDANGEAYVAGRSDGQTYDFATVKYSERLIYQPRFDFLGVDTIGCTLTDAFGNQAAGTINVTVVPSTFRFNLAGMSKTVGGMQLQLDGIPGDKKVVVEASSDLNVWQAILTNFPVGGSVQFVDPGAVGKSSRFYRAVQEQ
jgi:hypothetical protein